MGKWRGRAEKDIMTAPALVGDAVSSPFCLKVAVHAVTGSDNQTAPHSPAFGRVRSACAMPGTRPNTVAMINGYFFK